MMLILVLKFRTYKRFYKMPYLKGEGLIFIISNQIRKKLWISRGFIF